MNQQQITLHTLPNGLRVVHIKHHTAVGWAGLAIDAGSRDEDDNSHGLAHFVEHTIFKGTTHRRAWHINSRMERVGGELNAYTTKETTMLYSVFPGPYLARALELLADLACHSVFPQHELQRELDVVLEEAASYRDTPAEAVFDDFEDLLFAGSQLGHNILGNENHLRGLNGHHCHDYVERLYTPQRMVLFCVDNSAPARVMRMAERYFGPLQRPAGAPVRQLPPVTAPRRLTTQLGLHQAHTVVGARVAGMFSDERFALSLLSNILAGPGMNSLLNVELRERRGLVYTVESSLTLYTDCGSLLIYLGCDHDTTARALRIIGNTVDRIAAGAIGERALEAHKRQYCGQLLVASDSSEALAMGAGRSVLYYGQVSSLSSTIERIRAVTPAQLREAAASLVLPRCSVLTLY